MYGEGLHMLLTILIIAIPGVQCGGTVAYTSTQVCGLRGASVVLPCRYDYSGVGHYVGGEWYRDKIGRVSEHSGSSYPDCSLKINNMSNSHAGVYHFRFYTALHQSWITGGSRITVFVTDLSVKETGIHEQKHTEVTCSASCGLASHHQYVWYKNGQRLYGNTTASILVSDRAYYSCALGGHETLSSPAVCVLCRYSVTYTSTHICGLKGTSVVLPCEYEYREAGDYDAGEWYTEKRGVAKEHRDSSYPDCSLEIQEVADEHAGVYHFRFHTVQHHDWITGGSGITLLVTALEIRMTSDTVTEGEIVILTCNTTCSLTNNPTFTWYKNGQPLLSNLTTRDNTLQLNPVSSEDSGNYSCAVGGDESLSSPAVILNVRSEASGDSSMFLLVPAIIAIVIAIPVVLLIFGAVCLRRRQANAQDDPQHIYENGNIYQNVVRPRRERPQANMEFKVIRTRN